MSIIFNTKVKATIVQDFTKNNEGAGSTPVQCALLTERIKILTSHLQKNRKDYSATRQIHHLVSYRKKLLSYIYRKNSEECLDLIAKLNIKFNPVKLRR